MRANGPPRGTIVYSSPHYTGAKYDAIREQVVTYRTSDMQLCMTVYVVILKNALKEFVVDE